MATGWAGDGAAGPDRRDRRRCGQARAAVRAGPGLSHCEECEAKIPPARRKAVPGVRMCVACQEERDRDEVAASGYNRRGSKDSQLR